MTAQWVTDLMLGIELEKKGRELRMAAMKRRCSVPVDLDKPQGPKCTLDAGHDRVAEFNEVPTPHRCNVAVDVEGTDG